jgi:hypothetical protein
VLWPDACVEAAAVRHHSGMRGTARTFFTEERTMRMTAAMAAVAVM